MKNPVPAKKNLSPIILIVVFICGFLAGVAFTVYKTGGMTATSPPAGGEEKQISKEAAEAIEQLKQVVADRPDDYQSWIKLGHHYFDTDQPEKAIEAYTRSLALHSGDANLLTDLGVMYRNARQQDKAIESFDKARELDARHEPSRLNKGIVLLFDMNDATGAIASWEELLRINPEAKMPDGTRIQELVDQIKKELEKRKTN
jgi:cytochrome c-type biogenesis protein CcmH/NrfG